jgi:hypothetical protein
LHLALVVPLAIKSDMQRVPACSYGRQCQPNSPRVASGRPGDRIRAWVARQRVVSPDCHTKLLMMAIGVLQKWPFASADKCNNVALSSTEVSESERRMSLQSR